MKKALALLIAVAMLGSLVIGCNKTEEPKKTEPQTENADDKETEPSNKEVANNSGLELTTEDMTIVMWDISTDDPFKTIMEDAVARFEADYPNIDIQQQHAQNDTYKQDLIIAMSAGQCPNMYIHWGGGPMAEYYEAGYVNDITEYMNNNCDVPFLKGAIAQCTYDDKILAVPFSGIGGSGIYYNKTILAECGIEVPTTIAELEAACETLLENGYTPFSLANMNQWTGSMYFMYLVARYSGNAEFDAAYFQKDGGSFTSPAFIKAVEKIQDWVEKGYFPSGVNSLNTDTGQDRELLYSGQCAMMLHGTWQSGSIKNDNEEWYMANIDFIPFPIDEEAEAAGIPQDICVGTSIGNGFSFNCWNADGSVNEEMLKACFVLATQYINDDQYVKELVERDNRIPAIEGVGDTITDHTQTKVWDMFSNASNVQLWYDQYLPAAVTEVHKDMMSHVFGLTKTPQEIGEAHDAAMQEYWASK